MLTFMRRNAGSWVIKLLLVGVALSFLIGFGPSSVRRIMNRTKGGMSPDVVAKVGDVSISRSEFLDQLEQVKRNYMQMGMGQNSEIFNTPFFMRGVLSSLIETTVLALAAKELGISASDGEVAEYIKRMGTFIEKGRFSRGRLMNYLHRSQMSLEEYESSIRFKIAGSKLSRLLQSSVYTTDDELWQAYRRDNEKMDLEVIRLTKDMTPVDPKTLTEEDLKAAYEKSPEDFRIPEKRKLDYFYLSMKDFLAKTEITDEQVNSYFKGHQDEFKEEEQVRLSQIVFTANEKTDSEDLKKKAEQVRAQAAEKGGDFAALAKKWSNDEITAKKGGDIGWKTREGGEKAVMEKVFDLPLGEVSEVVETPAGYKIVKVADRRPAGIISFDMVKEQIRINLQTSAAREAFDKEMERIYGELTPQVSLRDYAQKAGLEILSTPFFTKSEPVPGIEKGEKLAETVFAMAPKEISKPYDGQTRSYIYQIAEVKDSAVPPFEEAKEAVRVKLAAEKSGEKLSERAQKLLAALKDEKSTMAQAAAELGAELISTGEFTASSFSVPKIGAVKGLIDTAFAVPENSRFPKEPLETKDGRIIFRVVSRSVPSKVEFDDGKTDFEKKYLEEKGNEYLRSWVTAKQTHYPTIENQEFWSKLSSGSAETN